MYIHTRGLYYKGKGDEADHDQYGYCFDVDLL